MDKAYTADEIESLFREFISKELMVVLLFLSNVTTIQLLIHDGDGCRQLAEVQVHRENEKIISDSIKCVKSLIKINKEDDSSSQTWQLFHSQTKDHRALMSHLAQVLDEAESKVLKDLAADKLLPNMSLAFPLGHYDTKVIRSNLFTFLPLPIPTGFPCNIHALFALAPDRQRLANLNENCMKGSRDR